MRLKPYIPEPENDVLLKRYENEIPLACNVILHAQKKVQYGKKHALKIVQTTMHATCDFLTQNRKKTIFAASFFSKPA